MKLCTNPHYFQKKSTKTLAFFFFFLCDFYFLMLCLHSPIDSSASILLFTSEIDVVGIDEAQFFDSGLIDVCNQLANNGIRVIVAGLDMDFRGIPFGPMPGLCAIADEVSKVHAICVKCGQLASFSHRTVKNDKQVLLGETEEYEPLCRECYQQAIQADQKESGH